jgi:membrane protein
VHGSGAAPKKCASLPATDADKITVKFVIDQLERRGTSNIPVLQSAEMDKLSDCLRQFDEVIEKSPANVLLKNL